MTHLERFDITLQNKVLHFVLITNVYNHDVKDAYIESHENYSTYHENFSEIESTREFYAYLSSLLYAYLTSKLNEINENEFTIALLTRFNFRMLVRSMLENYASEIILNHLLFEENFLSERE